MTCRLSVGPVRFVLQGEDLPPVRYGGWAYRDFVTDGREEGGSRPLMELVVRLRRGVRSRPSVPPLFEAGQNWAVWPDGDGWLFCSGYANRERPRFSCRLARGLECAELGVDGDPTDAPLRYPLDQILTWALLSRCGGVLLHAAAGVRDGMGWALAGRSGAGKSTLSALCQSAGWRVWNDDRTLLFRRDGEARMAGTPWHGSGRFAEAGEAPLGGILLLAQSAENRAERLSASEARRAILEVASIPWFEDAWAQGTLDALDALLSEVPVFRFHFTRTPEAVRALECFQESQEGVVV